MAKLLDVSQQTISVDAKESEAALSGIRRLAENRTERHEIARRFNMQPTCVGSARPVRRFGYGLPGLADPSSLLPGTARWRPPAHLAVAVRDTTAPVGVPEGLPGGPVVFVLDHVTVHSGPPSSLIRVAVCLAGGGRRV